MQTLRLNSLIRRPIGPRIRRAVVALALFIALIQVGLTIHQVHHFEKNGHVPCELCLVGGGHCVTIPATGVPTPDVVRSHELPEQARRPAILSVAAIRPQARAPPA